MKTRDFTGYLAARERVDDVIAELSRAAPREKIEVHDRLVLGYGPPKKLCWSQNTWINPRVIQFNSIGEAASSLTAMQRNWTLYSFTQHRRAKLIQEKLPPIRFKPLKFPSPLPKAPLGSWTLLDHNTLVASPDCSSLFPHGEVTFAEDKLTPPNRAYLKLWEVFTLLEKMPGPGERCLDLGSSPGGWTWVLQQLGAHVTSVDKAPLADHIARLPNIQFMQQSAFALKPSDIGPVDWLFSDVICYPSRLFKYLEQWLKSGTKNFICTLKFQGETDFETIRQFAAIEDCQLRHLSANKHELTWIKLG